MAKFETRCPGCGNTSILDVIYQGRIGLCPICKRQFPLVPVDGSETKIIDGPFEGDSSFSLAQIAEANVAQSSDFSGEKTKTITVSLTDVAHKSKDSAPLWQVGDVLLGVYEIRPMPNGEPYAEGGVGLVHHVYHREWDIDLAVKSPKQSVFQVETGKLNYERECQTWIELGLHPNIVTCYLVRRIEGIPRLFAEFVPDGSLNEWVRDKRLYQGTREETLKRILDIAIQFAWGLDYSHQQGVLHLDVKPANVMLSGSVAKVTDFGLARAIGAAEAEEGMQWHGMTPSYCSPEQFDAYLHYKAGNRRGGPTISAKSDIWSWAISVLTMFHGRAPCKQGGQTAHRVFEQYIKVRHTATKPVMPDSLRELLWDCFQVDPEQRPESMDEIAARLVKIYEETFHEEYPRQKPSMTVSTVESLNNRAVSLLDLDKPLEAMQLFAKASRLLPWHPQVTFNQAILAWRYGHLTDLEMLDRLETLARMKPGDATAHLELGLAQKERGNLAEANRAFQKALEIEPKIEHQRHLSAAKILIEHNVRCLERFQVMSGEHVGLFLSTDERLLLFCTAAKQLVVCETKTGRLLLKFRNSGEEFNEDFFDETSPFSALSEDLSWEVKRLDKETFGLARLGEENANPVLMHRIVWNDSENFPRTVIQNGRLYAADRDGRVEPLTGHVGDVLSTASTPDGKYAVSGGSDKTVRLWEITNHRCVRTFRDGEGLIQAVFISRDLSFVLSLTDQHLLKLWKTNALFKDSDRIRSPWMLCLVSSSEEVSQDQSELTQLCDRAKKESLDGNYAEVTQLIAKAKKLSGWTTVKHNIDLWNMLGRFSVRQDIDDILCGMTFHEDDEIVSSVSMASSGKRAVSVGRNHLLTVWDLEKKIALAFLDGHFDWIRSVDMTPDGRFAVSASWDQTVRLWDVINCRQIRLFQEQIRYVGQVVFSPDARYVAASSAAGRIFLFDALAGMKIQEWQAHDASVTSLQYSRDGRFLLSAGEDGMISLWNIANQDKLFSRNARQGAVMSVAFSGDQQMIVSGGTDGTIHIWNLAEEKITPRILKGHLGSVTTLKLTVDDRWLFSGSKDATIRIWNLRTGESKKPLTLHTKPITDLAMDWTCQRLISSSEDQTVRVWDMEWDYVFPGWNDGVPELDAYITVLLNAYYPGTKFSDIKLDEPMFWKIRIELEYRGFGWIRPESLWIRIHQILQVPDLQ